MASNSTLQEMNSVLNPFIHQVTGSTPTSIKAMVKSSGVNTNPKLALQLATAAIFSATVNKSTLETFAASPLLQDVRAVLSNQFALSGKINMSALSLFGHCLLTSSFLNDVDYVRAFRDKMGLRHIWEGELSKDRLSEKQFLIFSDKKKKTSESDARCLGQGYFKFVGLQNEGMTDAEAAFWGTASTSRQTRPAPIPVSSSSRPHVPEPSFDPFASPSSSPPRQAAPLKTSLTLENSETVDIDERAIAYFKATMSTDDESLKKVIRDKGAQKFETLMLNSLAKDPEMRNRPKGSTVG